MTANRALFCRGSSRNKPGGGPGIRDDKKEEEDDEEEVGQGVIKAPRGMRKGVGEMIEAAVAASGESWLTWMKSVTGTETKGHRVSANAGTVVARVRI